MKTKIGLAALLLLGGLAQGQQDFYENKDAPFQASATAMEYQQPAATPQQVWVARYKGISGSNGVDIAVDYAGEVYVLGGMKSDLLTIKYNGVGAKQWEEVLDISGNRSPYDDGGPKIYHDFPLKLIPEDDRNIYVAGFSRGGLATAYVTLKYDNFGTMQWSKLFNNGQASDFVMDNKGNVYMTGTDFTNYATVKYDKDGLQQWVRGYDLPKDLRGNAVATALSPDGNICVTGTIYGVTGNMTHDYGTIKYSPAGVTQWTARYNGAGNARDEAKALAVDAAGNVYVTGYSRLSIYNHVTTIKYNRAGVKQWEAKYRTIESGPIKMWVDGFENVYIAGFAEYEDNYKIIKYKKSGIVQWIVNPRDGINEKATISDMFVDHVGNVYVTGSRLSINRRNWDYVTMKYNSAGRRQWLLNYNGPQNGNDHARALAVDGSGNVYVTGQSYGLGQTDIVTIKYAQNSSGAVASKLTDSDEKIETVIAAEMNLPDKFYLAPNYPNPFWSGATSRSAGNPSTTLRFGLPQASHVTLKVYNVLSEEIATLIDGQKPADVHAVDFTPKQDLPSGIYFYVLRAGSARLVQRMVFAK